MLPLALAAVLTLMPQEASAMSHARGTFDVAITPVQAAADAAPGAPGRMIISKTYHGDIAGTGAGEMLATMGDGGSGAYVAIERVEAKIEGRTGGFSLVHRGVLDQGAQDLSITVVPGSGAGELTGITGVYHLTIDGGVHRYDLEYALPTP